MSSLSDDIGHGQLHVYVPERRVLVGERLVDLTAKEFDLLVHLALNPGRVFSHGELLAFVWGSNEDWQARATVTEHVRRLRRKLAMDEDQPPWIQTVRKAGYRFERRWPR